ncbi:MAG: PDZ domain-containing protein [Anaerolineales bacterium]
MNNRTLLIGAGVLALFATLGLGAAAGGALAYLALRSANPAQAAQVEPSEPKAGVLIAAVEADSPAVEAGLARGDILLEVNGQEVNDARALHLALADLEIGDQINLTAQHGDERRSLTATLGERDGRPYLGIVPCGPHLVERVLMLDRPFGTLITEVAPDSPAAKAGLEEGDHILAVDGKELTPDNNLADAIAAHKPGDTVTLSVGKPDEEPRELAVTLGVHPEKEGTAYLGVRYRPLPQIHFPGDRPFHLPDVMPFLPGEIPFEHPFTFDVPEGVEQGAVIGKVAADSPAASAGLKAHDVITAIDGEPVEDPRSLADAVAALKPGDTLTLTVYGPGEEAPRMVEVTLGEHPDEADRAYLGVTISGFFIKRTTTDAVPFPGPEFHDFPDPLETTGDA